MKELSNEFNSSLESVKSIMEKAKKGKDTDIDA